MELFTETRFILFQLLQACNFWAIDVFAFAVARISAFPFSYFSSEAPAHPILIPGSMNRITLRHFRIESRDKSSKIIAKNEYVLKMHMQTVQRWIEQTNGMEVEEKLASNMEGRNKKGDMIQECMVKGE